MTIKEKRLAAHLLRMASSEFANHGCDDLDNAIIEAAGFTPEESTQFAIDYEMWNSKGRDEGPERFERMTDWMVMAFLAHKLYTED